MLRLQKFSFRFAEQVLNSKLTLKQEIENTLTDPNIDVSTLSRPKFNEILEKKFVSKDGKVNPPYSTNQMILQLKWIF